MKPGNAYQLRTPTLAILTDNERQIPVTVPANATVVVQHVDGPMVDVKWDGITVVMFAIDLDRRGRLTDITAA